MPSKGLEKLHSHEMVGKSLEELLRLCFANYPFSGIETEADLPVEVSRQLQMDWASSREHPEGYGREFLIVRNTAKAHLHGDEYVTIPGTESFSIKHTYLVSNPTDDPRVSRFEERKNRDFASGSSNASGSLSEPESLDLVKEYLLPAFRPDLAEGEVVDDKKEG
ncbi:MAG TPA: hypothetical protein VFH37_01265 [Candidatus Saccharimonadales bacterium]|nr:hypothetical protein [Candidatus Saccharimonadales bacterium]